jgi:hypothetical protein
MHDEKSRPVWSHCQQGLPCLSAVAPTPSGAFHAPRVKVKTVWNYSLNAMAAVSTIVRYRWRNCLISSYGCSCPCSLAHILVPARRNRFASSFVAPAFFHRSCPSEWEGVVHIRQLIELRPMVDSSLLHWHLALGQLLMCWHAVRVSYSLKCDCSVLRMHRISLVPLSCC